MEIIARVPCFLFSHMNNCVHIETNIRMLINGNISKLADESLKLVHMPLTIIYSQKCVLDICSPPQKPKYLHNDASPMDFASGDLSSHIMSCHGYPFKH
jgi:hypothetical protein